MTASPSGASARIVAKITELADTAVLIELGTDDGAPLPAPDLPRAVAGIVARTTTAPATFQPLEPGPETSRLTVALAHDLRERRLPGVLDVIPAYRTILLNLDPDAADVPAIIAAVQTMIAGAVAHAHAPSRLVTLPVAYGGAFGPDLESVAELTGLSPDEVIARHASGNGEPYLVAFVGFSPGFAYLLGLPNELAVPRLASPRTAVPVGAVAIGGTQTGGYPLPTPGGWRIIGRTPVRMVDPTATPPSLLQPGDRLRFEPITEAEYDEIAARVTTGAYHPRIESWPAGSTLKAVSTDTSASPSTRAESPSGEAEPVPGGSIIIERGGLLTTVQDLGRPGYGADGISAGGALDRTALILGNRLVGNDPGAAALEITLVGPTVTFPQRTVIALTGADLGATLDGNPVPLWKPILVEPGSRLMFDVGRAARSGARAYLCVAGGIQPPIMLGSRSTDLTAHFGGHEGRPLRDGDRLPIGKPPLPLDRILRRRLAIAPPDTLLDAPIRIVPGPQADRISAAAWDRLLNAPYVVSSRSNRMGIRLSGPEIELPQGADLLSEGIAHGAIQVPGDGQPIVLLAGRQTVGGYPKPAIVISADLDRLGQARPGDRIRFRLVTPEEAAQARADVRVALAPEAVTEHPRDPQALAAQQRMAADLAAIAREAGLTSLHFEVRSADISVEIKRVSAPPEDAS